MLCKLKAVLALGREWPWLGGPFLVHPRSSSDLRASLQTPWRKRQGACWWQTQVRSKARACGHQGGCIAVQGEAEKGKGSGEEGEREGDREAGGGWNRGWQRRGHGGARKAEGRAGMSGKPWELRVGSRHLLLSG